MVRDGFAPGYEEAVSYRHGTVSFNTCRVLTLGADTTIYIYMFKRKEAIPDPDGYDARVTDS